MEPLATLNAYEDGDRVRIVGTIFREGKWHNVDTSVSRFQAEMFLTLALSTLGVTLNA